MRLAGAIHDSSTVLRKKITQHQAEQLWREQEEINACYGIHLVVNQKKCIQFSNNDYLSLSQDKLITATFQKAIKTHGFGSEASVMVLGYFSPQKKLEEAFADYIGAERSVFFNSGYAANIGIFRALFNKDHHIISDRSCHASLLEGIMLSHAQHCRYPH